MTPIPLETLFLRYRAQNDLKALAQVFDRTAPHLQALARRMGKENAEDLLQETYLAAIENAAAWDETRPLVPWLLGILTNRAQRSWAQSARTPDPHRLPQREVASPDSPMLAREFSASLEEALGTLSPVLRQTVQGALYDGQTPTQLAVSLGLRPGTVRQRLRRGLGELRLAWKGAFLFLFGMFGLGSKGLAATRSRILGHAAGRSGAAMHNSLGASFAMRLGVGSALVGMLGLTLVPLWMSNQQVQEPLSQQAQAPGQGTALQGEPTPKSRLAGTGGATPSSSARTLSIQVLWDGSEEPASDRTVLISYSGKEDRSYQTDGAGELRIPLGESDTPRFVTACATENSPSESTYVGSSNLSQVVQLLVNGGGSLSGQVFDQDGNPVPHAVVQAWQGRYFKRPPIRTVQANSEGQFLVTNISDFTMVAHGDGLAGDRGLKGKLLPGESLQGHVLTVSPASTITGTVTCPDGSPAVGAEVKVLNQAIQSIPSQQTRDGSVEWFLAGRGETTTDAQGRFEVTGLPPRQQGLTIRLAPYLETTATWTTLSETNRIELSPGRSLSGFVLDANGKPIPGAEVCYWPYYGNRQTTPYWSQTHPDDGSFTLRGMLESFGLPSGLLVRANGYAVQAMNPMPNDPKGTDPVRIKLLPGKRIFGHVQNEDGSPAVHHLVRIEGDRYLEMGYTDETPHTWEKIARNHEVRTDAQGRFEFRDLYPGHFQVKVFADDSRERWLKQTVQSGGPELAFQLSTKSLRKVAIQPTVVDGATGKAILDFSIAAYVTKDGVSRGRRRTLTENEGQLEAAGIEPGQYYFSFSKQGYVTAKSESKYFEEGNHPLHFTLWPMRSLQVLATTDNGAPIHNLKIKGTGPDGTEILFRYAAGGGAGTVRTSKSNPHIHGLPYGPVKLTVECEFGIQTATIDLSVPKTESLEIQFPTAQISSGDPVEGQLAVWFAKHPSTFEEGDKATPAPRAKALDRLTPANRKVLLDAIGSKIETPKEPFTVVIELPNGSKATRVEYAPTSEADLAHGKMRLTVHDAFRTQKEISKAWSSGTTMTRLRTEYYITPRDPKLRHPIDISFRTPPGECRIHVESVAYEPVTFRWIAEELGEDQLPPILMLKRKKLPQLTAPR